MTEETEVKQNHIWPLGPLELNPREGGVFIIYSSFNQSQANCWFNPNKHISLTRENPARRFCGLWNIISLPCPSEKWIYQIFAMAQIEFTQNGLAQTAATTKRKTGRYRPLFKKIGHFEKKTLLPIHFCVVHEEHEQNWQHSSSNTNKKEEGICKRQKSVKKWNFNKWASRCQQQQQQASKLFNCKYGRPCKIEFYLASSSLPQCRMVDWLMDSLQSPKWNNKVEPKRSEPKPALAQAHPASECSHTQGNQYWGRMHDSISLINPEERFHFQKSKQNYGTG